MSLYFRVDATFYTHRKLARLRAKIGDAALWVVTRLWAYAVANQPDGDFSAYDPEELAVLIGYTGDAQALIQALLDCGFMDPEPLRIHDWAEYNGFHVSFAERARRAAKARWAKRDRAPSSPAPPSPKENENESESETSNAKGMLEHMLEHPKSLEQAGGSDTPTQNRCSLEEAVGAFKDYSPDEVKAVWLSFEAGKNGETWMWGKKPVSDWKVVMETRLLEARKKRGGDKSAAMEEIASLKASLKTTPAGPDRNRMIARLDALRGLTSPTNYRERATILKEIEFKKAKIAEIKNVHWSQCALGGSWDNEASGREHADLKKEVQELEEQLRTKVAKA